MREGRFVLLVVIGVITTVGCQEARCPPGNRKVGSHCYDRAELSADEAGSQVVHEVDSGSQSTIDAGQPDVGGKHDGGSPGEAGAAPATCSTEVCDDIDNDCDGVTDEAGATDAKSWFQDCDMDGYSASAEDPIKACAKPDMVGGCSWTSVRPQPETKSNWDCDDSSADYKPGADFGFPPDGKTSFDLDCNGDAEPRSYAQTVGEGALEPVCNTLAVHDLNLLEDPTRGICPQAVGDGCMIWANSEGRYTTTSPSQVCPDKTIGVWKDQAWEYCVLDELRPHWPCR